MRSKRIFVCWVAVCALLGSPSLRGQQPNQAGERQRTTSRVAAAEPDSPSATQPQAVDTPSSANPQTAVPRLIKYSGILQILDSKAISGSVDVTFSLYPDEAGGSPLWFETQTVQADAQGRYTVLLGAMTPAGVPMDLFTSGEAHWLGVQVSNLPEQSRVLLVSVPYAMKAGDAETLGGRPASEYQLTSDASSSSGSTARGTAKKGTTATGSGKQPTKNVQSPTTNAFTQNYIPVFADNTGALTNSIMVQSGTKIGINTNAPAVNLDLNGAVLMVGTKTPLAGAGGTMRFRDDTGTQRWLFGLPGSAGSQDFQMYNYANGHAPLFIQNGAASYSLYLHGNGNVGIGTTSPAAKLDVSGNINLPPTATGGAAGVVSLGSVPFFHACCNASSPNIFVGASAGNFSATGTANVALGWAAMSALTSGATNTAAGFAALGHDLAGSGNAAFGANSLPYNTSGSANTAVGVNAGSSNQTGTHNTFLGGAADLCADGYNYATSIGFGALACANNALALGGTGTYAVNVGIGVAAPYTSLHIRKDASSALGPRLTLMNGTGGAGAGASVDFDGYDTTTNPPTARIQSLDDGNFSSNLGFSTKSPGSTSNALVEQVRISSYGSLIVDSSHNNGLQLSSGATAGTGLVFGGAGSGEGIASCRADSTTCTDAGLYQHQYGLDFYVGGVRRMFIDNSTGALVVFTCVFAGTQALGDGCSSDARLKTNIEPFHPVLDKLAQLQPVHFNWRRSNPAGYPTWSSRQTGLIAQDVEKVFPGLVSIDKNGYRKLEYGELPYLLLEGVRELKARNDSLLAEVNDEHAQLRAEQARITHEDAELHKLTQANAAKDAQLRKLTRQVEQWQKAQIEMAAVEARLARLEGKLQSGRPNASAASAKTGKSSKPKIVQVARMGF